jgi:N-acetylglucosaminyldiphosphoundecaprenol N-acetyl-beta-D-mannosaminyltransferase
LISDLCTADGMPIVWIARLMGLPIRSRIAGSDIFEALKRRQRGGRRLKVFLFGGGAGVATAAAEAMNSGGSGICCVGALFPGFGSVEEMSPTAVLEEINASRADFLLAALGARKGQAWLRWNHDGLKIPIRAHLGATINFEAGTIQRAPAWIGRLGLEWLWRITEEPHLWRRYFYDALALSRLICTRALPLAVEMRWVRLRCRFRPSGLRVSEARHEDHVVLHVLGDAVAQHVFEAIPCIRTAAATNDRLVVDLSGTRVIDARFLGLLFMLTKQVSSAGKSITFVGASPGLARSFHRHGAAFLLAPHHRQ